MSSEKEDARESAAAAIDALTDAYEHHTEEQARTARELNALAREVGEMVKVIGSMATVLARMERHLKFVAAAAARLPGWHRETIEALRDEL